MSNSAKVIDNQNNIPCILFFGEFCGELTEKLN